MTEKKGLCFWRNGVCLRRERMGLAKAWEEVGLSQGKDNCMGLCFWRDEVCLRREKDRKKCGLVRGRVEMKREGKWKDLSQKV